MEKVIITVKVKKPYGRVLYTFKKRTYLETALIDSGIPRWLNYSNKVKYNSKKNIIKIYTSSVVYEHAERIRNFLMREGYILVK